MAFMRAASEDRGTASRREQSSASVVELGALFADLFGRNAMDRSFYEARWVLVPMLGLMILIVLAGAMLG